MTEIRGLAFDLDGVLADSARLHFLAWRRLAEELGIRFTETDNEALKGIDRINSLRMILRLGGLSLSADEEEALAARKNGYYVETLAQVSDEALLPGAMQLLAEARSRGLSIGLASASRNAPMLLDRLGIAGAIDFIADPAHYDPKPAPGLFAACAKAFGLPPEAMVGFEDAGAGIVAIKAAGMYAVGIGSAPELADADMLFPDTASVDLAMVMKQASGGG